MFTLDQEACEYYGGVNKFQYGQSSPLQRFRANFETILHPKIKRENFAILNELEQLILSDMLTMEEQNAFIDDPQNQDLIAESRQLNISVDAQIEKTFSQFILSNALKTDFIHSANPILQSYLQRFDSIAKGEIDLGNFKKSDRVLFIGGGAFPISAINYVRYAECHVSCVEKIPEIKAVADQVIAALHLEKKITPVLAEGQEIDCSSYDVIIVGVLARPKKNIIQNILSFAKKGTRIICRTTFGVRSALCPPLKIEEVLSLRPIKSIIATGNQTLSSVLFKL